MRQAISNAGPLIHLDEIGKLDIMAVFDRLFVSGAVFTEATATGRVDEHQLQVLPNLDVYSVEVAEIAALRNELADFDLQEGELSALCLCRSLSIPLLLTDDLETRRAAKLLGIEPHGTVGVLVYACRAGRLTLTQTKEAIQNLLDKSTLFLTPVIVEQAIAELERG